MKTYANDFLDLLAAWVADPVTDGPNNNDGTVGITDFLKLLADWGTCS